MIGYNLSIQQRFPQLLCVFTTVSTHGASGYHGFYKFVCVFTTASTRGAYGYLNFRQVCVCFHNSFHNWGLWLPLVSTDFTYRLILLLISILKDNWHTGGKWKYASIPHTPKAMLLFFWSCNLLMSTLERGDGGELPFCSGGFDVEVEASAWCQGWCNIMMSKLMPI